MVRHQLATKAAQLKEAQRAYDTFMVEHPEVPRRLAELDQAFEQERELERGQHWELSANASKLATSASLTKLTTGSASTFELLHHCLRRPSDGGRVSSWARGTQLPRCRGSFSILPVALTRRSSRITSPFDILAAGEAEPSVAWAT